MNENKKKKKKGFTLVELLIVIGISGILMAMAAPKYQGMVDKANQMEQRAHVREALSYIDIYILEHPGTLTDESTITIVESKITGSEFTAILAKINVSKETKVSKLKEFAEKGTPPLTP